MSANPFARATRWLHTMYPQGTVERLPGVGEDGTTNIPGVYVAGDLAGVPLLKFSLQTGARAVKSILADPAFKAESPGGDTLDVAILGGGVAGLSAALECRAAGLSYAVLESAEPLSTIVNFPKGKRIYLYPADLQPDSMLRLQADTRETLLAELHAKAPPGELNIRTGIRATHIERRDGILHVILAEGQPIRACRVIVAIGRSGNFRRLGVPGEDSEKVSNRLHDPADFADRRVLVVGGGDSALEAAVALASSGAEVTLSYRGAEFARAKPENIAAVAALQADAAQPGRIHAVFGSSVECIEPERVWLRAGGGETPIPNEHVFVLIGREAPLEFFRRSGIPIQGEWTWRRMVGFAAFLLFCVWLYNWKAGGFFSELFAARGWFPFRMPALLTSLGGWWREPSTLGGTLRVSMGSPSFYYSLAYCLCVGIFGWKRIRRRRTPYVRVQTVTLFLIQVFPLFLLPEVILPLLGNNGVFDSGFLRTAADNLFPAVDYGHGREYWRSAGFVLAWPLFLYNFFTEQPMSWWLAIGCVQTFVVIPALIYFFGKGAYCGWICSCGALAETLGDAHRTKMPHGPFWSRLNMAGQAILLVAVLLMILRIIGWAAPESPAGQLFHLLFDGGGTGLRNPINYKWIVDVSLAGIVGVGFYFWYSGRVWCRFFCPLAALMHIYAKFSRFRIIPDKKKCISCNVCTSVCHQGIDIMSFANKGIPMEDPECVRCSACVQMCPTGVLEFGQVDASGNVIRRDSLAASPLHPLTPEGPVA